MTGLQALAQWMQLRSLVVSGVTNSSVSFTWTQPANNGAAISGYSALIRASSATLDDSNDETIDANFTADATSATV